MEIENADMRIIKWEIVWNDNREEKNWERERERERERDDISYNCKPNC